jgi:hypothetical protein
MSKTPISVAHLRKKRFLPELSPDVALDVFRASYVGLIIGAALVLISTLLAFWSDSELKFHDSIRLSANERETAQAKADAAQAQLQAEELRKQTAEANARAAEANRIAEEERSIRLKAEADASWRMPEPTAPWHIRNAVLQFAGQPFTIRGAGNDLETGSMMTKILMALRSAQWVGVGGPADIGMIDNPGIREIGIRVVAPPATMERAKVLAQALTLHGAEAQPWPSDGPTPNNIIEIIVGRKAERARK